MEKIKSIKEKSKEAKKEKKKLDWEKIKNDKGIKIAFNILAVFCIMLFCFAITPKALQNDTFYTIKIGQDIRANGGIDYQDHYSWHENLEYMYPHWLYDVLTSLVFDFLGGHTGIYIATIVLSMILGVTLYFTNKKISKNALMSFFLTLAQMAMCKEYIAARAQLVTFVLFVLTVLFIEKFLEKPKVWKAVVLVLIPTLIANLHAAVWPFYFVLYMPYIGEYLLRLIIDAHILHKIEVWYLEREIKKAEANLKKADKSKATMFRKSLADLKKQLEELNIAFEKTKVKRQERRKNPYKLKIERNDNVKWLILVMIVCLFTGLLTPLRDMPYTYTIRTMMGNTTKSINEHLPLTLIDNKVLLASFALVIGLLSFTKVKIKFRDLLFISGLTLLAFITRRQISMLVLFGGFVVTRLISDLVDAYDKNGSIMLMHFMTTLIGEIITIVIILCMGYTSYAPIAGNDYINSVLYPVDACEWIKENLDYKNIKIFNDYNYGSYMLLQDIPVFIDSRCDLYTPEFNGKFNWETKKFEDGKDIFSDYINISGIATHYENKFNEYGITHVITRGNSKLNLLLSRDTAYKQIYKDDSFIIYER